MSITAKYKEKITHKLTWVSISCCWTRTCLSGTSNLTSWRIQSESLCASRLAIFLFLNYVPVAFKFLIRLFEQETLLHCYWCRWLKIHRLLSSFWWFYRFWFLYFCSFWRFLSSTAQLVVSSSIWRVIFSCFFLTSLFWGMISFDL